MAGKTALAAKLDEALQSMSHEIIARALAEVDSSTSIGDLLEDFQEAGYRDDLEKMSVRDFAIAVIGNSRMSMRRRSIAGRLGGGGIMDSDFNTRTQEGREAIDEAICRVLESKGSASAEEIRSSIGGSPPQIRESAARLGAVGKVHKTGERRATRYHWSETSEAAPKPAKRKSKKKTSRKR